MSHGIVNDWAGLHAPPRWPKCGHPRTQENTRQCRNRTGPYTRCLICHRADNAAWHRAERNNAKRKKS